MKNTNYLIKSTIFAIIFAFNSGCLKPDSKQDSPNPETPPSQSIEIEKSDVNLAKPLVISSKPEDVELGKRIDSIIKQSAFRHANWGFIAISLKDGRILSEKNGQNLMNPASVLKLFTTSVALEKLGADFRWKTSLLSASKPNQEGVIDGDLTLYGRGAPDFDSAKLAELVNQLKQKGVKKITGNVVGDESFFKGDALGDGWLWGDAQWYYGAEASALAFNENLVSVSVSPTNIGSKATAKIEPNTSFLEIVSDANTVSADKLQAIGVNRAANSRKIYLWGNAPLGKDFSVKVSVPNVASWASVELKGLLEKNGIAVGGQATSTDWKSAKKLDAENAIELGSVESQTLGEIVKTTNKNSVNLNAELILRTLGQKFGKEAPDADEKMNALRGDDLAGTSVVKKVLIEKNIATDEISMHDGSGLSRLDFVSPEMIAKLLVAETQMKNAEVFRNSLPIAGIDGTLRGRLKNFSGRIFAKTGSMTYGNSLAGYAKSSNGETYAFAIICNGETLKNDSVKIIDEIVGEIGK